MEPGAGRLTDVGVAIRLRRLWTDGLGPWLEARDHDLGTCWRETALVRRGLVLDLLTPVDFGSGDPFEGIRRDVEERLAEATDGRVRQVTWRLADERRRTVRRPASAMTDAFHAGDPTAPVAREEVAAGLRRRVPAASAHALAGLRVAAVSRHRIWLVTPDVVGEQAVRTTPGAGAALFDAVRRLQRSPRPLYSVTVDDRTAARSPALVTTPAGTGVRRASG